MIKLLVLDVDGCMSDGKIIYGANGDEIKSFNVKDGLAIATWIRMGKAAVIITGRRSAIVERRAKELKIEHLYQGVKDKRAQLLALCDLLDITPREVAAIGDDLNDYTMLQSVKYSYTPADGSRYIKDIVKKRLTCKGGEGAVREMIEDVVAINDEEELFLSFWRDDES